MDDFLLAASWLFDTAWTFLTSFNLPGVNFTPAAALFMTPIVVLSLKFIRSFIGRINPSSVVSSLSSISKSSKGDK